MRVKATPISAESWQKRHANCPQEVVKDNYLTFNDMYPYSVTIRCPHGLYEVK